MDDGGFRQANKQVKHRTQYKMYVVSKKYAAMGGFNPHLFTKTRLELDTLSTLKVSNLR